MELFDYFLIFVVVLSVGAGLLYFAWTSKFSHPEADSPLEDTYKELDSVVGKVVDTVIEAVETAAAFVLDHMARIYEWIRRDADEGDR
jgi:hypothetical protein